MKFTKEVREKYAQLIQNVGSPPGSLVYTGPKRSDEVAVQIYDYNAEKFTERTYKDISAIAPYVETTTTTWIDVSGIHDIEKVEQIGKLFQIHTLVMEDIMSVSTRPKMDEYDHFIFISCKMIYYNEGELKFENINLVGGENFVISFQEEPGDVFNSVRQRIERPGTKIRQMSADFLLYALMDAVVDHYYIVLEQLGEELEELENKIEQNENENLLGQIHDQKKKVIKLRRSVYPLREVVSRMEKSENKFIKKKTVKYIRDLYDHTIQIIETIETFRENVSGLSELYMTAISNRMNSVMKVLTIVATIFIPITFIAGIYGMNFEYMPELKWKYSYFVAWSAMIIVALGMLYYFWKKKWL